MKTSDHTTAPLPQLPFNVRNFLRLTPSGHQNHRCNICSAVIEERYFLDPYGTIICHRHTPQFCCLCARIIIGDPIAVPGYGYACFDCGREKSYQEVELIRRKINNFYSSLHIYIPGYQLRLVSPEEMNATYGRKNGRPPLGAARKIKDCSRYAIDLMSQQSKLDIGNTLAHELLHLWQYHRNISAPLEYAEGFCNLGAFLFTSTVDKDEALVLLSKMMENRDRNYGSAFRQLKILYDIYGLPTVIAAMKTYAL